MHIIQIIHANLHIVRPMHYYSFNIFIHSYSKIVFCGKLNI